MFPVNPRARSVLAPEGGHGLQVRPPRAEVTAGRAGPTCSAFCSRARSALCPRRGGREETGAAMPRQVSERAVSTAQSCFRSRDWASEPREVRVLAKAAEEDSGGGDSS